MKGKYDFASVIIIQEKKMHISSEKVPELIKELRLYLGLSLASFGKPIGYGASHIKRLEDGVSSPREDTVMKICEVFDVDPRYFDGKIDLQAALFMTKKKAVWNSTQEMIAMRLKEAREEKNLTMLALSKISGVSEPMISVIENCQQGLSTKSADKLAEALEVGVEWLLTGEEKKKRFPADKKLIEWLWNHPEIREELWEHMKNE